MNDQNRTSAGTRRHPGRVLLLLGALLALAGPLLYFGQLQAKVLTTPWYAPILASVGLSFVALSLMRARSIVRWAALVFFMLFAGSEWAFLVGMGTPAYTGPVKSGQSFPAFTTTLADGSTFGRNDLKGDQKTVLVFFRGRW
jgi:hypothetical protein